MRSYIRVAGADAIAVGVQRGAPKDIHRLSLVQKFVLIFQSGSSIWEISTIFWTKEGAMDTLRGTYLHL